MVGLHFADAIEQLVQNLAVEADQVGDQPDQQHLETDDQADRGQDQRLDMAIPLADCIEIEKACAQQHADRDRYRQRDQKLRLDAALQDQRQDTQEGGERGQEHRAEAALGGIGAARLLAVVALVMMSLFLMTGFLTGKYRREKHLRAENQFEAGQRLECLDGRLRWDEWVSMFTNEVLVTDALAIALDQLCPGSPGMFAG